MEKYYIKEKTPLRLHRFIHRIALPIGALGMVFWLAQYCLKITYFDWRHLVDIEFYAAFATAMMISFGGFFEWKAYAYYAMMTYLVLVPVYIFITILILYPDYPLQAERNAASLIGTLIYDIPVGVYYYKRKPLFMGMANPPAAVPDGADEVPIQTYAQYVPPADTQKYCHTCGARLSSAESQFCPMCGTKIIRPVGNVGK